MAPVLVLKLRPLGKLPVRLKLGAGKPVAVGVYVFAAPATKVVVAAPLMPGAWFTVSVKLCDAAEPTPLLALSVSEYVPPLPPAGVPESTPVVVFSVTPLGRLPVTPNVGAGSPDAVTVKLPALPTVNVLELAEVIAGACVTPMVTVRESLLPTPLLATIVTG